MKKKRQISLQECYVILQIENDATLEDVKKAYRKRAFELHPDLNPNVSDASYQFQRLNEAYVALSQILETEEGARKASAQKEEAKQKTQDEADKAKKDPKSTTDSSTKQEQKTKDKKEQKEQEQKTRAEAHRQRQASAAYAKEDVLRDLLHDPFARRVFEDIYSEVSKQEKPAAPPPNQDEQAGTQGAQKAQSSSAKTTQGKPSPQGKQSQQTPPTVQVDIGDSNNLSHVANNFSGKIMGWFRQQIDETQSIKMPASALFPGARIRLQIRRGLSDELSTVEIMLPKDFIAGKPIRLRGLGKKVGKWQGDLYLTIDCLQKTN